LHRLGQLQAENWISRGTDQAKVLKTDGSEYQLTLALSENGTIRKLVLNLRLGLRGQPYASVNLDQGEPVVFLFPVSLYAMVLQYLSIPSQAAEL
jgi:hypothetical protein